MGVDGTSTWRQGVEPTLKPPPAEKSSKYVDQPTLTAGAVKRDLGDLLALESIVTEMAS